MSREQAHDRRVSPHRQAMQRDFVERRQGERRKQHAEALRLFFERVDTGIAETRTPAQQAHDGAFVADWTARFTDLRIAALGHVI